MNNEATMLGFRLCALHSSFVIPSSFVIRASSFFLPVRHSSFVISAHGP
jgi:hypothetical protein